MAIHYTHETTTMMILMKANYSARTPQFNFTTKKIHFFRLSFSISQKFTILYMTLYKIIIIKYCF